MHRLISAGLLSATCLALAGCGSVERTFGLVRDVPDEFTVETRAPLSMPPDFALQPPAPGAARPQEVSAQAQAEAAIAPDTALGGAGPQGPQSAGQHALVAQAGPAAPADIRDTVNKETKLDHAQESLTDRLLFWRSAPPVGTMVDAKAESQRLRENAALGQSPIVGDTPVIVDKPKSSFLGIF